MFTILLSATLSLLVLTSFTYTRGGQLVVDCDRIENFVIARDRPVGNKITSTKCHKMQRFSCK